MVREGKAVPMRTIGSSVVGRAGHLDLVAAESMASAPPAPPVTAPAAFPNGAETGGAAARRYHLVHGSKVPYTDLSAVRPSATNRSGGSRRCGRAPLCRRRESASSGSNGARM